jgi:anti-sigma-K factor RskA
MTPHDWFVEQRTAFVVRSLEPDEERTFREHLGGCEACRGAVEQMERELAWLPMGVAPVTPRPGLSRVLVEGVLGRRRAGAPWWIVPASLAASLVIAAGAWIWAARLIRSWQTEALNAQQLLVQELAMARDTLEIIRTADKVRHADITMAGKQGGLVIFADDRTHRWNVVVYGLPTMRSGQVCQFWFITDSGMVRSVEVKSDGRTPALLTLPMPPSGGTVMGAALTLEPAGSSGASPQGQELAHLMM